ncbi:MAG: cysteine synthase A [Bacillota bacterium]
MTGAIAENGAGAPKEWRLFSGRWRAHDVLEVVGGTPLVRLGRPQGGGAEVWAKMEGLNPAGSVKDRIARAMIAAAEREGKLKPGGVIVEPTSGNTGIGLAMVAAAKGYRLILTMPDTMSVERRNLLKTFGAELVLTPGAKGMRGAVEEAEAIVARTPGAFMPQQFENPANPEIHRQTTAREILDQTGGHIDAFVAGVGTGGTITGVGEVLKKEFGDRVKIYAVEPAASPLLSGGQAGPHRIQGIGPNFIPKVLNRDILDGVIPVTDDEAFAMMAKLSREYGLLVGISSGAAVHAAFKVAAQMQEHQRVVTVMPDTGERYLSLTAAVRGGDL